MAILPDGKKTGETPAIDDYYFQKYSDKGLPYGEHWDNSDEPYFDVDAIMEAWEAVCARHDVNSYINSLLDLGSATGSLLDRFDNIFLGGVALFGVEPSQWCKENALLGWKRRTIWESWLDCSKQFEDNEYECILDFAVGYTQDKDLDIHLREVRRVASKGVIQLTPLAEVSEGNEDDYRVRTESYPWWKKRLAAHATEFIDIHDFIIIWR